MSPSVKIFNLFPLICWILEFRALSCHCMCSLGLELVENFLIFVNFDGGKENTMFSGVFSQQITM